ncbi:DUF2577 domain-containing protein [Chakrabartyella piscis]|uniref:DUF2577 domain-containing protein n=1 Tax=Chakrabartyella piscis TaxID=2918914 RepID=UPI00295872BE|nr:DUF2577 domain-containing protein [Chakrabartyella piscis]
MKKLALEAVDSSNPTKIVFGKVVSSSPLQIKIDDKMTLSSAQLMLTRNISTCGLTIGEEMVLVQMQGGQKYLVLDGIVHC